VKLIKESINDLRNDEGQYLCMQHDFALPGTFVRFAEDDCYGIIVSRENDSTDVLVLWTDEPSIWNRTIVTAANDPAREIALEIDRDILNKMAAFNHA